MSKQSYMDSMARADAWENQVTGQNTECDKSRGMRPLRLPITPEDLGLFYQVDDVAQRVVDRVVDDALRCGFDLAPSMGPRYEFFWKEWRRLNLSEAVNLAWKWGRLFGDAILVLNIDDGQDPSLPLRMDSIRSIRWAHVLDMMDYDIGQIGRDPNSPYFRKPEVFRLYAQTEGPTSGKTQGKTERLTLVEVHASRVVQFCGKILPWRQYQDNDYFHESVLQPVWKPQANYDAANEAVAKLMPEIRQMVVKIPGLIEIVAAGGDKAQVLERRLAALDRFRSVHRMVMIDSEEEMTANLLQLSGVENVLRKLAERVVGASGMPHTIVLGEGSEGNTSGRTEKEEWFGSVAAERESYLLPRLERLRDLILSQSLAPSPDVEDGVEVTHEVKFPPLALPTPGETANTYKTTAEADAIYHGLGVLTSEEIARSRFSPEGFKHEVFLDDDRLEEMMNAQLDLAQEIDDDPRLDAQETFVPPETVAKAAQKGLDMRRQFGRGGTAVGVARARDLSGRKGVSLGTISRMVSFFARHEQNKSGKTETGEPSNGTIAWALWGGDPGREWAEKVLREAKERGLA